MYPAFTQKISKAQAMGIATDSKQPFPSQNPRSQRSLAGNKPSQSWGSKYSGNPQPISPSFPTYTIKISPPNAKVPLRRRHSAPQTVGSSNSEESLSKKCYTASDQVESNTQEVGDVEHPVFSTESKISSKPSDSSLDSYLVALKNLAEKGAIQVTYPKQSSGSKVETPTSAVTQAEIKNTSFSEVFSQFSQEFSHKSL